MEEYRLPKRIFYGKLMQGKCPQHKPRMRFKDVIKNKLKALNIDPDNWEELAKKRDKWRYLIRTGFDAFQEKRVEHAILKRAHLSKRKMILQQVYHRS